MQTECSAALAGKSTLNRLELSRAEPSRYHKISYDAAAIEGLFFDLFLDLRHDRGRRSPSISSSPCPRPFPIRPNTVPPTPHCALPRKADQPDSAANMSTPRQRHPEAHLPSGTRKS